MEMILDVPATAGPLPPAAALFAVVLQLLDFWLHDPSSWFVDVEAQLALHGILADHTKFHHVVTSLDPLAILRAMALLRDPPTHGNTLPSRTYCCGDTPSLVWSKLRNFSPSLAWAEARLLNSCRTCPCSVRTTGDSFSYICFSDSCLLL